MTADRSTDPFVVPTVSGGGQMVPALAGPPAATPGSLAADLQSLIVAANSTKDALDRLAEAADLALSRHGNIDGVVGIERTARMNSKFFAGSTMHLCRLKERLGGTQ